MWLGSIATLTTGHLRVWPVFNCYPDYRVLTSVAGFNCYPDYRVLTSVARFNCYPDYRVLTSVAWFNWYPDYRVLTSVAGFNCYPDYRSSIKVQVTEGRTHQRTRHCGRLQDLVFQASNSYKEDLKALKLH